MPLRLGLATYDREPQLAPDDRLLLPALTALGIAAEPVVWSSDADWARYDAVIIRSCWDYHKRFDEFRRWRERLATLGVPTVNPAALVEWNSHKSYLLELADRGVSTLRTVVIAQGDLDLVSRAASERGWSRAVLKPTISASGHETHLLRFPLDAPAAADVARVVARGDALLQPFAEEIPRDGELSVIFLGGAFSHAARKRVGNDFRVQVEHGGTAEPERVSDDIVQQARRVLDALPQVPVYARVDGIVREGRFVLMELELIEPHLFLGFEPQAAARLAAAIVEHLSNE